MPNKKFVLFESSIIQRNSNQISSEIDNEVVMLSIENEEYYNLNEIGSEIWNNISNPISFKDLISRLTDLYNIDAETCIIEVKSFLHELYKHNLLNILR